MKTKMLYTDNDTQCPITDETRHTLAEQGITAPQTPRAVSVPLHSRRRTPALPFIVTGMILLSLCAAHFALPDCKGQEAARAESKAGDPLELTMKDVKFRFRWCPAGTFEMGSLSSETGHENDETQHQVTLSKGFWLLETEVTQEQWESVTGENPSYFKGAKLPVEKVSWDTCQDFVKKLNALGTAPKGYKFALPTESQWEYACRAGTTGAYAGDLDRMAWYDKTSDRKTHEVGTKQANAWGLYDMHGNVFEWCNDWYDDYPTGSVTDPMGASSGSRRVSRGGCWLIDARRCRSARRSDRTPGDTSIFLGVRVSLVSGE